MGVLSPPRDGWRENNPRSLSSFIRNSHTIFSVATIGVNVFAQQICVAVTPLKLGERYVTVMTPRS